MTKYDIRFEAFFSVDSPKAIKAAKYNYLNAINYMSPHKSGGVGNLCSHASTACIAICLGLESGQAMMVDKITGTNSVRESRKRKAAYFMGERVTYLHEMFIHVARKIRQAKRIRMKLCVRPNGSTDVAYEGIRLNVTAEFAAYLSKISGRKIRAGLHTVFSCFPFVQFVDYTKNWLRMERANMPTNYDLTFSYSGENLGHCLRLLAKGINVAVCFETLPESWHGFRVIDGDKHDLRFLDPKTGIVVGLLPKGNKARRETLGFVIRDNDGIQALAA